MTSPTAAAILIATYFAALILLWAWAFLAPVERVEEQIEYRIHTEASNAA